MHNRDKTAVGYCRFSSEHQRSESIDAQKRAIQQYADENGITILEWYLDYAQSGTTANRKEFQNMIDASDSKTFSTILVHKLDRFSRDKDDTIFYKVKLKRNGVRVFSVTERFDDSPEGELMETIIEGIASYYSKNLSRETMKGMRENAYNAKSNGGLVPFGYKLIPRLDKDGQPMISKRGHVLHDIVLDDKNCDGARLIFDRVLEGKTYMEICKELKDKGFKTSSGADFSNTTLLGILRNEKYTGTYVYNKCKKAISKTGKKSRTPNNEENIIRVENGLPAIINREKFNDIQKLLDSRIKKSPGNKIEDYLLSGKMICGECGASVVGERQRKEYKSGVKVRMYYKCTKKRSVHKIVEKHDCPNTCIRKDEIEQFVLKEISKLVFSDKNFDAIFEMFAKYKEKLNDEKSSIADYKKQLAKINKSINNITDAIMEVGCSETLKNQLIVLESDKNKINNEIIKCKTATTPTILRKNLEDAYKSVKSLFESGLMENSKKLIDIFVNKVVVCKDRVELYLNAIPSLMHKDYGLDIDLSLINEKEDNAELSSLNKIALDEKSKCIKVSGCGGWI